MRIIKKPVIISHSPSNIAIGIKQHRLTTLLSGNL
jgi:hypothetical protein